MVKKVMCQDIASYSRVADFIQACMTLLALDLHLLFYAQFILSIRDCKVLTCALHLHYRTRKDSKKRPKCLGKLMKS